MAKKCQELTTTSFGAVKCEANVCMKNKLNIV